MEAEHVFVVQNYVTHILALKSHYIIKNRVL
jgi:hypothetical protein